MLAAETRQRHGRRCARQLRLVPWGHGRAADSSLVEEALRGAVLEICATMAAFAAVTRSGAIVAWGSEDCGGRMPTEAAAELCDGVERLQATAFAFAALKRGGHVAAVSPGVLPLNRHRARALRWGNPPAIRTRPEWLDRAP